MNPKLIRLTVSTQASDLTLLSLWMDGKFHVSVLCFQNVNQNRPLHTELSAVSMGCLFGIHRNQTIWKQEGFLSQDGGEFSKGQGGVGWGFSSRHLPPYESVLDSNTSVVHVWSIASAQPTLCQLQPDDLTLFRRQLYPRLTITYTHTQLMTFMSFMREGGWWEVHAQRHKLLCVMS